MKSGKASFPYPLLGHEDDIDSQWSVNNFTYTSMTEEIEIHFTYHCDDPDFQRFLDQGLVTIMVRWECSATISSGFVTRTSLTPLHCGGNFVGTIAQQNVRGNTEVHIMVIASGDIPNLQWQQQHEDYGDSTFNIRKGDILSVDSEFDFNAKKLYDPANPPLNSCFRFVADPDSNNGKGLTLDYGDSEQIIVRVPKQTFDTLRMMGNDPTLQISLLVFPSLIDVIAHMKEKETIDTSTEWYSTLQGMMHEYNVDCNNPIDAAQKLLRYPLYQYTEGLIRTSEEGENKQ
jgi:hypothetical protein